MSNQSEKPPILTDTYGLRSPKAAQAGVGARTLQEISEATEAKPRTRRLPRQPFQIIPFQT